MLIGRDDSVVRSIVTSEWCIPWLGRRKTFGRFRKQLMIQLPIGASLVKRRWPAILTIDAILHNEHPVLMQLVDRILQIIRCPCYVQGLPLTHIQICTRIVTEAERVLGIQKGRELHCVATAPRKFRSHSLNALAEPRLYTVVGAIVNN